MATRLAMSIDRWKIAGQTVFSWAQNESEFPFTVELGCPNPPAPVIVAAHGSCSRNVYRLAGIN